MDQALCWESRSPKPRFSTGKDQAGPESTMPVSRGLWGMCVSHHCHSDHGPSLQVSHPRCWGWFHREETSFKHCPSPNHLQQGTSQLGHHFFVTISGFLLPEPALLPVQAIVQALYGCVGSLAGSSLQPTSGHSWLPCHRAAPAGSEAPEGFLPQQRCVELKNTALSG